ncbi:hypothetical protein A6A40_09420 [Azospirillum humicireducens]|uniref:Uncharacterized protein n=1 Tax=Azospirillum humicireducens TaxID=1226968 RepID=A0A160JGN4_9PROT|nr:hypothetical protein [Azospirillum humicireducens]ANC92106.1 hypothetical protein A6A40_09420 [Azospirillum humicireducens]
MSTRMENGLRTLVLALYDEAALTAAAKGLTGLLAERAALCEAASLAAGPARRTVSEEEVLRIILAARRIRRLGSGVRDDLPALVAAPIRPAVAMKPRRGRLAVWAMRSLTRRPSVGLV